MKMEFDSLDVEKDFPGLYASDGADGKSKKSKEDSDFSDEEHEKVSKKELLIGRRKDKKDKGKDRGYAALEGESSPEEDIDVKSPSKSKKSKAFIFTTSKSREKREKSRDKSEKDNTKELDDKLKDKDKLDKEKDKKKDKDRKEKLKKEKSKDKHKEKLDKKSKQLSNASEEVIELGDVQPVFGVSVSLATERSRCHDGIDLPLVVRDCIDYLQENALRNEQIYKVEPVKTRLQHFKRLYNNRERQADIDELDIPTACSLLKLFLRELPEPILTTDLMAGFEEVASHAQVAKQQEELQQLLELLPKCNKTLLSWILIHFDAIIQNEKFNKMNAQSLAMLLSPPLQMSHRLLVTLLCYCPTLFPEVKFIKYVPPITSSSPKLPETPADIHTELRKQDSLLTQLHAEMNAGFVSKKREEQLWEVQRIITQLKRKLRSLEKHQDKSVEEVSVNTRTTDVTDSNATKFVKQSEISCSDEETTKFSESVIESNKESLTNQQPIEQESTTTVVEVEEPTVDLYIDEKSGFLMVPKTHPEYMELMRLQIENQELLNWKVQLQARISAERVEMLRLKQTYQQQSMQLKNNTSNQVEETISEVAEADYEPIIDHYIRENSLLEQKRNILSKEIFDERRECIALQVEIALRQF